MLSVFLETENCEKCKIIDVFPPISGKQLTEKLTNTLATHSCNYFFKNNGRLVESDDVVYNGDLLLVPKLCGGKGGFGSMLRAIGAQIEKTTNREACRDLSGRRLRDINEEKRLKAWIDKQSTRNEEAAERKKKKLEKLCAEPKHEFKDKTYEQQRSELTERVEDAVEVGFAAASTSVKRAADQDAKKNLKKKKKTLFDLDNEIDSDDLSSDTDDENDEKEVTRKEKACVGESDTENSSDRNSSCQEENNEEEMPKITDDSSKSTNDSSKSTNYSSKSVNGSVSNSDDNSR